MASNEDWRSAAFRQKVISQIEEAVKRSGNPNVMMKNPSDMESQVYSKAKTRVDYLAYVARLLVYIRDIRPAAPGQQQASAVNINQQPGMRLQFPSPQINKPQTVSTMGGQVPMPQVQQSPMGPQQVFYNKSGLTQEQILAQHLQQQQQQQPLQRVQQQQQQQQQHPLTTQSLLTQQAMSVNSQNQGGHLQMTQSQPYIPPNQVASPMPVQQQPVHQVQQTKHAVQVRMPHVPSPATGPNMSSSSMRAPTPSSSLTSQATVAPSPAPFVPSPAIHPSPSPQHYVPASPAASTSVPTPSTMNVQSPASVPNPASVGAPAASPAPLNPAEEQAYLDKLNELKPYVEPLTRMINKLNRDTRDKEHSNLFKLKHLYDILTNPAKRLPLQALENSGNVLKKLIPIKPPSVPTPPAPPTPSGNTISSATTTSVVSSVTTTTSAAPVIPPAPIHTIYKPLFDAVTKHAKSPMLGHTLKRTFSPLLQAMEGPPILPLPPPVKKVKVIDNSQKKCTVPHVLQGELARLCSRFQVKSGARTGAVQSNTLLECSINDLNLPAVPPIEISVPQNYPYSSPECKTANYNANPFLQKVQKQLSSRLQRMPEMYSVTSVLNAWESSIRQACIAEVAVN